ncbi:flagellar assembly protein FliW [Jeotgalibacillus aurantiacus]|uniref:flagellar assembly protein FliW n=1 Tax=Jeotgalibacillus aurantiacus TaxID=2763266 RepID=UPI001D09B458|nr:flagellar assembly protein FliW [Jeotgalibacillus aurantiacus]
MKLSTKYHGTIDIEENEIWHFEQGIPGFEGEKQFVILSFEENSVFYVLQSVNNEALAFIVTDPFSFYKEYEIKLDDAVTHALQLEKPEQSMVYVILTVRDPFKETTANLQAPLVLNTTNRKAKQIILNDYSRRQPVAAAAVKE